MSLYDSGDLFLPQTWRDILETPIIGSYESCIYITGWSIMHFISGILFGAGCIYYKLKYPYWYGLVIHTLWELWQIVIGMNKPCNLSGHNGIIDITMDTLLFMLGIAVIVK